MRTRQDTRHSVSAAIPNSENEDKLNIELEETPLPSQKMNFEMDKPTFLFLNFSDPTKIYNSKEFIVSMNNMNIIL